ncbi:MAG: carbamoyltransferase HypF [Rhodospirillaceae bacterium]|nr:carbamoyltransferase HypF [Rhodospirillaceae bacterium]
MGGTGGEEIRVLGIVQGVGFRPTVWRLARDCGLAGDVRNDGSGVRIRLWGAEAARLAFVERLRAEPPPLARIDAVERRPWCGPAPTDGFAIAASEADAIHTIMPADAATCRECVEETLDPTQRRYRYPFTNCTHCGPRLTIVARLPYDRPNTSMAPFALCPDCRREYEDPADRRFHAQPIACPACGPSVALTDMDGRECGLPAVDAVAAAALLIARGDIVAVKGIGGYHLACDATDAAAVARLRQRKRRYGKPFAVMARDLAMVRRYCTLDAAAEALLTAPAAPIVLLAADGDVRLAEGLSPGLATLGVMLPYTPLHHLLLRDVGRPVVMTSGNPSHRPQCIDDAAARVELAGIADWVLSHDRGIVNRADDSVMRIMAGRPQVLRRGRGLAPSPLALPPGFAGSPALLALGAELKNTFCLVKDGMAILSQHQGDLEDASTEEEFRRNLALFETVLEQTPSVVAVDRHPDYLSTKYGRHRAEEEGAALVEVQHHHAHIASCMAENGLPLDGPPVLGVALDGLGFGDDGTIWGGEFLLADYRGYRRLGTFRPVAMIGGAQAIREPWRNAFAHLDAAFGWDRFAAEWDGLDLLRFLTAKPVATLGAMLRRGINCPPASSCGRLFDAVAAAVGLCRDEALYEGQAAAELEALVPGSGGGEGAYPFAITRPPGDAPMLIDSGPMWLALLRDLADGVAPPGIAARFHRGLAGAIAEMVSAIRCQPGGATIARVALSGGVFQNKVLLEQVVRSLSAQGCEVLTHSVVPANDGGLSLGQAVVAAARHLPASGVGRHVLGHSRTDR